MSKRIIGLRKELKLTQEALGKLAGVGKQAVSSWEREISEPQRDALLQLQKTLQINPNWILATSEQKYLKSGNGEVKEEGEQYHLLPPEIMEAAHALASLPQHDRQEVTNYIKTRARICAEVEKGLAANFNPDETANTGNNLSEKSASLKAK